MVLFTSNRPLERAENLKAVYDAYDGEKRFSKFRDIEDLHSGRYSLQVTDELTNDTVGKCLYIGHSMGAAKTFGLDQPHPYFHRPSAITCAIASSLSMVPVVAKQIGISEDQVVPAGMPRTDAYFSAGSGNSEPVNFLYAPTFRGGRWYPYWDSLQEHMSPGDSMVVKAHPVTGHLLSREYRRIIEGDSRCPSTPYLMWCDVLITDYSSIMFDAFVMRKPVVLFAKDRQAYLRNRGMYCKYPERYSEYFCDTEKVLMWLAHKAKWNDNFERLREFHVGACDGKSTERVIALIRSMI